MPAFSYDDEASLYVGVTLLSLYTLPASVHIVRTLLTWKPVHVDLPQARTEDEKKKVARLADERGAPKLWTTGFKLYVGITALAAVALVVLCIVAAKSDATLAAYDPYGILGIASGASDREIRSAYRKLSMTHHPDKGGDATTFQKIAKAYEALMDPVARENWEKFGNPDGKQTLEVAIGIPSVLVGEKGRYVLMLVYLLVLAGGIPSAMHYFWRKNAATRHVGLFGLHVASTNWLGVNVQAHENREITLKGVPEVLAGMFEFMHLPPGHTESQYEAAEAEKLLVELGGKHGSDARTARMKETTKLDIKDSAPIQVIHRNNILLHAHLNRRELNSAAYKAHTEAMLKKVHAALEYMWLIAYELTMNHTRAKKAAPWLEVMTVLPVASAQLTQALYGKDRDLLQVFPPELTGPVADIVRVERKGKTSGLVGIADLLRVPRDRRASMLAAVPGIDAAAAAEYCAHLDDLPLLEVEVKYEVTDEEYIAENDLVTVTVTLTHANVLAAGGNKDSPIPAVRAPRFPFIRQEQWVIYLLDTTSSTKLTGIYQPVPGAPQATWEPTKAVETVQMMYKATKAGKQTLQVHVQSMNYLGLDVFDETILEVAPAPQPVAAPKVANEDEEDETAPATADKTMEAWLAGAADESDVSDAEEDEDEGGEDGDSDEEGGAGGRAGRAAGGRARPSPAAASGKQASAGAMPARPAAGGGGGGGAGAASASAAPAGKAGGAGGRKGFAAAADEDELPSIAVGGKAGGKGKGHGKGQHHGGQDQGQPAAKKAGELVGDDE